MVHMKRTYVCICLIWLLIFDQQIGFQMSFSGLFLYGMALCSCVLNLGQKVHYHLLTSGFCPS